MMRAPELHSSLSAADAANKPMSGECPQWVGGSTASLDRAPRRCRDGQRPCNEHGLATAAAVRSHAFKCLCRILRSSCGNLPRCRGEADVSPVVELQVDHIVLELDRA